MIGLLTRTLDSLTGRGEAAVAVAALDGALRANRALDAAETRAPLADVDALAVAAGALHASAGSKLLRLDGEEWVTVRDYGVPISCIAPCGAGGLAVALPGEIRIEGGGGERRSVALPAALRCVTAIAAAGDAILVANGSATNGPERWRRDLMERNASGEVWRIDFADAAATRLAAGLAWPAGLAVDGERSVVVAEAWRHRLVRLGEGAPKPLYVDLAGYPGRLSPAEGGGWWLAVFAPRSQLVEFVLREPAYRARMLAEVPEPYWIAPCLRSGRSFYEPLQGGGVKQLGLLKPWAPTMSAGLCVRLDAGFQPIASLHSRADGATHGVTAAVEHAGRVWAAAQGDGVVVAVDGEMNSDEGVAHTEGRA